MKFLEKIKASMEDRVKEKYEPQIKAVELDYKNHLEAISKKKAEASRNMADVDALSQRVEDRRLELERTNKELRDQIRLIEAKAHPDQVWVSAFSMAFSKAWDMMLPIMNKGLDAVKQKIYDGAVDDTLKGLEPLIEARIAEAKFASLRPINSILAKRDHFLKRVDAVPPEEKAKFRHYVEAIGWVLDGNGMEKGQSESQ